MPEQEFHKGGLTAYAYNAAQAVNLRADGWVEGAAPPSVAVPKPVPDTEDEPDTQPVDPAPTAQEAP